MRRTAAFLFSVVLFSAALSPAVLLYAVLTVLLSGTLLYGVLFYILLAAVQCPILHKFIIYVKYDDLSGWSWSLS